MNFPAKLAAVSAEWVEEGIITTEQRQRLLARHAVGEETGSGRFLAILLMIGGALFLAGVALLVSANWRDIGDWAKIGALVTLLVSAHVIGWRLRCVPGNYPKSGDAFLMLACGLFMCGIALVSQIFHLNARPANGVLGWWLGIVFVPWLTRSKGAQFVSITAALTWLGMEMTTPGSLLSIGANPSPALFFAVFLPIGIALLAAGLAFRGGIAGQFAGLHEKSGLLIICAALYGLGFLRHEWSWVKKIPREAELVVALSVAAMVLLWFAWRRSRTETKALGVWLVLALSLAMAVAARVDFGDGGWALSGLSWLLLFVFNVYLVRVGIATQRASWVNLGIAVLALNIVTRYFDLFGTMLDGGIFFIVTGLVVIGLGIGMERKRRQLLADMAKSKEAT